jgi:hypothetical protein
MGTWQGRYSCHPSVSRPKTASTGKSIQSLAVFPVVPVKNVLVGVGVLGYPVARGQHRRRRDSCGGSTADRGGTFKLLNAEADAPAARQHRRFARHPGLFVRCRFLVFELAASKVHGTRLRDQSQSSTSKKNSI